MLFSFTVFYTYWNQLFSSSENIQYNLFITRFIIADIKYTTTSTGVGYGSGFELTKDTPYLALTGELWDVFCEYFDEKRSCYKGVLL